MKSFLSGRSKADASALQSLAGGTPPPGGLVAKVTAANGAHKDHAAAGTGPDSVCRAVD